MDPFAVRDVTGTDATNIGIAMTRVGVRLTFGSDRVKRESDIENAIALMSRGIVSVRLRIGWSDIVPLEDRPTARVVEELAETAARLRGAGLDVWPTLCGNRLPGWFLNEGAFADPKATDRHWSLYVDTVAAAIADDATGWIPFESPIALLDEGWRRGLRDPGVTDEAKFADAFGGVIHAYACVTRMLGARSTLMCLDVHHDGASHEVLDVFHEAALRGRLALPGRITRDIDSLQGGFCGIGLVHAGREMFSAADGLHRWRDTMTRTTYALAERFSPLAISMVAAPETTSDAEQDDLIDALGALSAEVRDGGAEFANVWLGDVSRIVGVAADQALSL